MSTFLLIAGALLIASGYVTYGLGVRRGLLSPSRGSWLIWSAATVAEVVTYSAVNEGAAQTLVFVVSSMACLLVTMWVWQHSTWQRPTRLESIVVGVCAAALGLWVFTRNSWWSHVLIVSMVPLSFIPTWQSGRTNPEHERSPAWGLWTIGDFATLTFIATQKGVSGNDLLYIVVEFLAHGSMWLLVGLSSIRMSESFQIVQGRLFSPVQHDHSGHTFLLGRNRLGKAVFAGQKFNAGDPIVSFRGQVVHRSKIPETLDGASDRYMQVGADEFLGPSNDIDDLINHSCDPNAGLSFADDAIELRALRSIAFGEEICWDYSTTILNDGWAMNCKCGSSNCRKFVSDCLNIPNADIERYRSHGVLPDYVLAALSVRENTITK